MTRLITNLLGILCLGLAQPLLLMFCLALEGIKFELTDLIKDGALIFFSSTITLTSFYAHVRILLTHGRGSSAYNEFVYSSGSIFFLVVTSLGCYFTMVESQNGQPCGNFIFKAGEIHYLVQLGGVLAAITYSLHVEGRQRRYSQFNSR